MKSPLLTHLEIIEEQLLQEYLGFSTGRIETKRTKTKTTFKNGSAKSNSLDSQTEGGDIPKAPGK